MKTRKQTLRTKRFRVKRLKKSQWSRAKVEALCLLMNCSQTELLRRIDGMQASIKNLQDFI